MNLAAPAIGSIYVAGPTSYSLLTKGSLEPVRERWPVPLALAAVRCWPRCQLISFSGFLDLGLDGQAEFVELLRIHFAGRIGHQVLRGSSFREGHHFADGFFAGQQ